MSKFTATCVLWNPVKCTKHDRVVDSLPHRMHIIYACGRVYPCGSDDFTDSARAHDGVGLRRGVWGVRSLTIDRRGISPVRTDGVGIVGRFDGVCKVFAIMQKEVYFLYQCLLRGMLVLSTRYNKCTLYAMEVSTTILSILCDIPRKAWYCKCCSWRKHKPSIHRGKL